MSDGDNTQWTFGDWGFDERWFGSSQRGAVPVGWTFSPATAFLAPHVLGYVRRNLTTMDELVAGPSGIGPSIRLPIILFLLYPSVRIRVRFPARLPVCLFCLPACPSTCLLAHLMACWSA